MNPNSIRNRICRRARWARSVGPSVPGPSINPFACSLFQNSKHLAAVILFAWAMVLAMASAENSNRLSAEDLAIQLRAGEDLIGEMLTLEADYVGNQTDPEGNIYALFISRMFNTTLLFLLPHAEDIEALESVEGTILRVELQEQDLRDHRIYAIWIEASSLRNP